jgi:hypothetical protein
MTKGPANEAPRPTRRFDDCRGRPGHRAINAPPLLAYRLRRLSDCITRCPDWPAGRVA